jgi:crossover junction endodeoxyribonuclease RuvC
MVARLCGLDAPPKPPDAADALALAVCHLWAARITTAAGAATDAGVGGPDGLGRAVAAALAREASR